MRLGIALLAAALVACGAAQRRESVEHMPSDTLEHSDPGADTSKNPVLSETVMHGPSEAPWSCQPTMNSNESTSIGCGACLGCSSSDPTSLAPIVAFVFALRRRRHRHAGREATS